MKTFTISLLKTIGGTAFIDANTLEEAEAKAEKGEWYGEELESPELEEPLIFGAILFDDEDNEYV